MKVCSACSVAIPEGHNLCTTCRRRLPPTRNRLDLTPDEIRVLETSVRLAIGQPVTDADRTYLASHAGDLSRAWSRLSGLRNYHHSMGAYG